MREIILDTESTGLDPAQGHRLVEIGCVELINAIPTGRTYQQYINPERDVPAEAQAVHGLTTEFVSQYPTFQNVAEKFLDFIGDTPLIIHNAEFDIKFINAELTRVGLQQIPSSRATCTMKMARRKYPGAPASLDALCRRFNVDNSNRALHGALLDCQLLAECYLELCGGRQPDLVLAANTSNSAVAIGPERPFYPARPHPMTEEEKIAHQAMLKDLKDNLWKEAS